jgi:hypothetical protein
MITHTQEEYIYHVRDRIRLIALYTSILATVFSIIYTYYTVNQKSPPELLFYINSGIYTISSILILINAHYIKIHAKEKNINLKNIKSLKIYDKFLFYTLLGNIIYTTSKSVLSNTFTIKKIYSLIISLILFGSLWINYNFLY